MMAMPNPSAFKGGQQHTYEKELEFAIQQNMKDIDLLKIQCKALDLPPPTFHFLAQPGDHCQAKGLVVIGSQYYDSGVGKQRGDEALNFAIANARTALKQARVASPDPPLITSLTSETKNLSIASQNPVSPSTVANQSQGSSGQQTTKTRSRESTTEDFETMIERIVGILGKYGGPVLHTHVLNDYNKTYDSSLPEKWLDFLRDGADEIELEQIADRVILSLRKKTVSQSMNGSGPGTTEQGSGFIRKTPSTVSFKMEVAEVREYIQSPSPGSSSLSCSSNDSPMNDKEWSSSIEKEEPLSDKEWFGSVPSMPTVEVAASPKPTQNGTVDQRENENTLTNFDGGHYKQESTAQGEEGVKIRSALIPMRVAEGEFKAFVVFAPDPGEFCVQLDSLRPLEELLGGMIVEQLKTINEEIPKDRLDPGGFYAGYDPEKGVWQRVQLCNTDGEMMKVFLVDVGHYSDCLHQNLRDLPQSTFVMSEMMAIKCRLRGIKPADPRDGNFFTDQANNAFEQKVLHRTVTVLPVGEIGKWEGHQAPTLPFLTVDMWDEEGKNVAEWMVQQGHARSVDT